MSGYYTNSLKSWQIDLQKQLIIQMHRYATMESIHHPDKIYQGRLIEMTRRFISIIKDELDDVKKQENPVEIHQ